MESQKPVMERLEDRLHLSATIETSVPSHISPGVDYEMHVVADNTGLGGEKTDAAQWRVYNPQFFGGEYVPNVTMSLAGPAEDGLPENEYDFFKDVDMFSGENHVNLPGSFSGRLVQSQGTGPANKVGDLGVYNFSIGSMDGINWGDEMMFYINAVDFRNPDGEVQDVDRIYGTSIVTPMGDLNKDIFVGQNDLDIILAAWGDSVVPGYIADPSGDGFVGQSDLDIVLGSWGQGIRPVYQDSQTSIPEPSTLAGLVAGAGAIVAGAGRKRKDRRAVGYDSKK